MGLGGAPPEWADYEWVDLSALPDEPLPRPRRAGPSAESAVPREREAPPAAEQALADGIRDLLDRQPLWQDGEAVRVLLADLDNLRAGPRRWRARMAALVTLARQADVAVLAGQHAAVERARAHLAEFGEAAIGVEDGSDVADHVLLDAAAAVPDPDGRGVQVVVVSNDGIFASLAARGPLVVLSPGVDALSNELDDAAADVLDLAALETHVAAEAAAAAAGPAAASSSSRGGARGRRRTASPRVAGRRRPRRS